MRLVEGLMVGKVVHYVQGNGSCSTALVTHVWKDVPLEKSDARLRVFGYDPEDDRSYNVIYSEGKELFTFHFIEGCK